MANKSTMQHFRARPQKSGKVYYYFDTGGKPRKEVPLGSDYVTAVRKWAELKSKHELAVIVTTFPELAARYEREEIPKKAASTQITLRADLKHLRKFFGEPPAPLDSIPLVNERKGHSPWMKNRKERLSRRRGKRLLMAAAVTTLCMEFTRTKR